VTLDAASLTVLIARLTGVADEMGAVLRRSASSPNIKERADCSAALFDPGGGLLVQAEHIPVHLGAMPASVRSAIDYLGPLPAPGDQVVVNDPFAGGTHLNDVTLVAPCHSDGELVGWVANRAHHADLGGGAPGSIPADATEIHQEGLRLPPVRLTDDLRRVFAAASRTPVERAGDLDAQVGANLLGASRLADLAGEPLDAVPSYGVRRMAAVLETLPHGSWHFSDVLDSMGAGPEQREPATIEVRLVVDGDGIEFDFTGSAAQGPGNVNAVVAVTHSAVGYAVRAALAPDLPAIGGVMDAVRIIAPRGSIVAAEYPAAVGAGNVEVSQRIADVCFGALAQVVPQQVPAASQGTMNNVLIGGRGWVYYETIGGGQGARPDRDGMSGIHTHMTNTQNTPIEVLERHFPMRVLRSRLRRGTGGAGAFRGGEGIERDLLVLEDAVVSLITERRALGPWGLAGGEPGAVGENWRLPGGDEDRAERLADKCTVRLESGDVLRVSTPGGGGWGAPSGP
jgi:N-methylhydantoinase B/oxoprolinase/acetone carboxylase alpha subunit